jgi:hypothetical protein
MTTTRWPRRPHGGPSGPGLPPDALEDAAAVAAEGRAAYVAGVRYDSTGRRFDIRDGGRVLPWRGAPSRTETIAR